MVKTRIWRLLLIGVVMLLVIQAGSWFLVGRVLPHHFLAADILTVTDGSFFIDDQSLKSLPRHLRATVGERLLADASVYREDELPASNRQEQLRNFDWGDPIYLYKIPHFQLTSWASTPIGAKVEFSLDSGGLHGGKGFRARYLWLGGFWIRLPARNPAWIA